MSNLNYDNKFNATITITEEYNNLIHLSGVYNPLFCNTTLIARYGDFDYESKILEKGNADSYFSDNLDSKSVPFDFYIPYKNESNINFFVKDSNGKLISAKIEYSFPSRINDMPYSFL